MDHNIFENFVRRTADLMDRRSLLGGLGGALLAAGTVPFAVEAKKNGKGKNKPGKKKRKKCKKVAEECRAEIHEICNDLPGDEEQACLNVLNPCCKKVALCKSSIDDAFECCQDAGFC